MDTQKPITTEFFARRFADLCLKTGMCGLPKDELSRHILFKSMVIALAPEAELCERDVNRGLARWIETSAIGELDHITLRRRLVDAGYLLRKADGTAYRVAVDPPGQPAFEADVCLLDLQAVLAARKLEIARRKAEYLEKAGK